MIHRLATAFAASVGSTAVHAHSFAQPYQLPMPYWMYIYGAMAALALSFVVLAFFLRETPNAQQPRHLLLGQLKMPWLRRLFQTAMFAGIVLAIFAGLIGNQDSYRNINMTYFWIVFALGGCYLSALVGGWYDAVNPWKVSVEVLSKRWPVFGSGYIAYPKRLAYWPALAQYMVFIIIELFGDTRPFSLSVILLAYTALTLLGSWLFGSRQWFYYADLFSVLFRVIGHMAPLQKNAEQRWVLQWPFAGLIGQRATHPSLLIFILFMLSSTAFDGLKETQLWFNLFWKDPWNILTPLLGEHPIYAYPYLRPWFIAYEVFWLLLSPMLYLGLFLGFLWLGKTLSRSDLPLTELTARFSYSLLPIALVYHITHYYTLLLNQGVKIRGLISDPFGWGWNIFGNAITGRLPIIPDMGVVWDSQVWLILIGHVASVWLAHVEALRCFNSRRQATLSQFPMLALMIVFTGFGLWILAQPLKG